jgi:hypothetical protein
MQKKIIYIAFGSLAAVGLGIGVYFMLRKKTDEKKTIEKKAIEKQPKHVYTDRHEKKAFVVLRETPSEKGDTVEISDTFGDMFDGLDKLIFSVVSTEDNNEGKWYEVVSDGGDKGWLKSDEVLIKD